MKILNLPIAEEEVRALAAGDVVYITGELVTGRDRVHERVVKEKKMPGISLKNGAVFHAGPIVTGDKGNYKTVAVGPTTSMRMEAFEADFIAATGVRIIIGKGGMGQKTAAACQKYGAVHLMFAGGAAVLAADKVVDTYGVEWEDLGMPEAMWLLRMKEFGPLVVSVDAKGGNLFEENKKIFNERKQIALEKLSDTGEIK